MSFAIAKLEKARLALSEAKTLFEVKAIQNMAGAAQMYARAAHLSKESLDCASEIKLLAERKAGEILLQLDRGKAGKPSTKAAKPAAISEYQKALKETNTPERTARHWQQVANIPENEVQEYIVGVKNSNEPVSTSGVLRFHSRTVPAKGFQGPSDNVKLEAPEYLRIIPLTLAQANNLVRRIHRHHKPCVGHRFSIGVADQTGVLRGAAIVGRAVARKVDQNLILEVSRLVTDGTSNACSVLYSACARVAKEMGYIKIQTYILESEPGTSLKASGWISEGASGGGDWNCNQRKNRRRDQPMDQKQRWSRGFEPTLIKPNTHRGRRAA
jgi:hypothetical protein